MTAANITVQSAQPVPCPRASSSPASTRRPRITRACVRKKPRGTALHDVNRIEMASPKARRTEKSASIGAGIISEVLDLVQVRTHSDRRNRARCKVPS